MVLARHWTIRDSGDDVVVEMGPPRAGGDVAAGASEREMASLLRRAIDRGDAALRRALEGLYRELFGAPPSSSPESLRRELSAAARGGRLLVLRKQRRSVTQTLEDAPVEQALGPPPPDSVAPDLVWIGINLVDQDGVPVPGRPYRVITPDGQTYSGNLDSHGTAFVRNIPSGNCQVFCPDYPPHDELTHVVQPGEHISGIALTYGFEDYTTVWKHPKNADLAAKRDVAHVLNDGDEVYVPALQSQPANKPTGAKHQFQIQTSPLKLRVKLLGTDMKPVANAPCTLDGTSLTSDGDGVVEVPVDKLTPTSTLTVDGTDLSLAIGSLDPLDDTTPAGWKARLFNLGFLVDPTVPDGDDEITFALRDFQAEYSLDVSGTYDDATQSKLKEIYGC